jgi:glycosyltransferase involved in cell wall biosynthesis
MKVLVIPRDPNPYQGLLYGEMEQLGATIRYLGELTPSHTLSLLLLPLEIAVRRARGAQFIHLHWVFGFGFPSIRRLAVSHRISQVWFGVFLKTARLLGLRMAWTAHNVLPHSPVFADEVAARRSLIRQCDLVFAHSPATLDSLAALGAVPRRSLLIRHGPIRPAALAKLRTPGTGGGTREFLFFGKVAEYKGVERLLTAFADLPAGSNAALTVAGQCDDRDLRARLVSKATQNVRLRLEYIPPAEVTELMSAADVVVLPFRTVTTSGSAELALAHGRPLIVPDLPSLAGLPTDAVTRYDRSTSGLTAALVKMIGVNQRRLATMSAAALSYSAQASWREIAAATLAEMESVLNEVRA